MKNKVKITVGGTEYTVVTQEDADYTKKLAEDIAGKTNADTEEVNESINDMCINGRISITAAAILTAVNLCDRLKKYEKEADSLGEQIEGYLHAASAQLTKYNELKKENEKLKKDIEIYKKRLKEENPSAKETGPLSSSVKAAQTVVSLSSEDEAAEDESAFFKAFQ